MNSYLLENDMGFPSLYNIHSGNANHSLGNNSNVLLQTGLFPAGVPAHYTMQPQQLQHAGAAYVAVPAQGASDSDQMVFQQPYLQQQEQQHAMVSQPPFPVNTPIYVLQVPPSMFGVFNPQSGEANQSSLAYMQQQQQQQQMSGPFVIPPSYLGAGGSGAVPGASQPFVTLGTGGDALPVQLSGLVDGQGLPVAALQPSLQQPQPQPQIVYLSPASTQQGGAGGAADSPGMVPQALGGHFTVTGGPQLQAQQLLQQLAARQQEQKQQQQHQPQLFQYADTKSAATGGGMPAARARTHTYASHKRLPPPLPPQPVGVRSFIAPESIGSRVIPGLPLTICIPPLAVPLPRRGRLPKTASAVAS